MFKLKFLLYFLLFAIICDVEGHSLSNKILSDADLQSALMPQELNPATVFDKDAPWRVGFPLDRSRRELEVVPEPLQPHPVSTLSQSLKLYSRVATFVALAFGAFVEILLYIVEFYFMV
ncbi:hypothetical protein PYW08_010389 [Mythimna loreyi]|uniref:Uncharacterized protein n=1 Tax=Mythimna loreyi TaxID=667449 RepID=A0ACC2Q688_9NEOP|nr:hypothetical protein PYW08_010389 [Mythimna loreyi]